MSSFSTESTIHGITFIFNPNHSKTVRFFWGFAFLSSFSGFCYYVHVAFVKLTVTPDVMLAVSQRPMYELPYPAISICFPILNEIISLKIEDWRGTDIGFQRKFGCQNKGVDSNSCQKYWERLSCENASIMAKKPRSSLENIAVLVSRIGTSEKKRYPQSIFSEVLTDRGFCYTSNMQAYETIFNPGLSSHFDSYKRTLYKWFEEKARPVGETFRVKKEMEWTLDNDYVTDEEETFPGRAIRGHDVEVRVKLNTIPNTYPCSSRCFSVILHQPNEIPTPFHEVYSVSFQRFKEFRLRAFSHRSDESLRKFSPLRRNCYFSGERSLKFFNVYTKAHCDWECLTNYTLGRCGCVKFSMPRNSSTPVCREKSGKPDEIICSILAVREWPDYKNFTDKTKKPCNCLPTCNFIKYSATAEADTFVDETVNTNKSWMSEIRLKFSDHVAETHTQVIAYRLQNFIADFGGLIGLFMGCSLLSIMELIYYFLQFCGRKRISLKCPRKNSGPRAVSQMPVVRVNAPNQNRAAW